jgi:hypothetical protein
LASRNIKLSAKTWNWCKFSTRVTSKVYCSMDPIAAGFFTDVSRVALLLQWDSLWYGALVWLLITTTWFLCVIQLWSFR